MDQTQNSHKSNIARPLSRVTMARATTSPTTESLKSSQLPRASASNSKKPVLRPLGESNKASIRAPSFGWITKSISGALSSSPVAPQESENTTNPTALSTVSDFPVLIGDRVNGSESTIGEDSQASKDAHKSMRKKLRPSLSERTVETLSQISPAPSSNRRRSSTLKSNGTMAPPPRPASAMRNVRPTTPSPSGTDNPSSPSKKHFRPPGKPTTPAKERTNSNSFSNIYTPPKAFMRDHTSRIGRPTRNDRRSVSSNISTDKEMKAPNHPPRHAARVKSLYDLRAASSHTLNNKPSLPSLIQEPSAPQDSSRRSSIRETSPHAALMKGRSPGENVLASTPKIIGGPAKVPIPNKKANRRIPGPKQLPKENKQSNERLPTIDPANSSSTLRDTIAKAKAMKKGHLRKSETQHADDETTQVSESFTAIGSQLLQEKLQQATVSGALNLSAMSLKALPAKVLRMYDFNENSSVTWAETVDLKKLILADNELESLPDAAFPDWSLEQLETDPEKSNQFGGLEVLDLHDNSLTSLPIGVRRLQHLQTLNLTNNKLNIAIFSIISELKALRELRLANNGLNGDLLSQSFSMTNLQILDLSGNQLDELPSSISDLKNLQKLLLGNNRLSSISLETLPSQNLIELDISNNMLGSSFEAEGLKTFKKLQHLDLSFNNLECLCTNFFDLPSLKSLALQNNRIDTLPEMSNCNQLITLNASGNGLTMIPDGFYRMDNLKNVDLSANNIRSISSEVMHMRSLLTLNLAANPLREKKYLTMNFDQLKLDFALEALPAEPADGSRADATSTEEHEAGQSPRTTKTKLITPMAGVLDASSCSLASLHPDQVDLSKPVYSIRLANNGFTTFPVELLMHPSVRWSLKSLDLSHNPDLHPVEHLDAEVHLPLLQSLYIVSTGLTTLDTLTTYLRAPELKELNISCHRLTGHIPWVRAWYPNMTTLLASDNWFDSIDVEAVRGLEVLDIRNNEIDLLPPKIGLCGNHANKVESGRLRSFECTGNKFRVPRLLILERGTEAVLKDLRRMVPTSDVPEEWTGEV